MSLRVDAARCTECGRCITICSLSKTGRIQPLSSMVRIKRQWPGIPEISVCRFRDCPGQPCIESCPFDAISIVDGDVQIIAEACRGCTKCIAACPFGAIRMDDELKIALKCDLCGGSPSCVPECVTGALTSAEVE